MYEIEKRMVTLHEDELPINISSLGGITAILADWDGIVHSRMADEFLEALILDPAVKELPTGKEIIDLLKSVINENEDPLVIRNTSLLICQHATVLKNLFDILLVQSGTRSSSFIRGHYLLAAFQIALLEKSKQYSLIGFLLEERSWDDEDFLQYLVKIMGLGYAFFNNEDLLEALNQLGAKLGDPTEFHFEMGMANIKKAIAGNQADQVKAFLTRAHTHFTKSALQDREDATCFALLIAILLDFSDGKEIGNIQHRIAELKIHLVGYSAYNRYHPAIGWASTRAAEMLTWYNMCENISSLSSKLGALGWLDPRLVIEHFLLDIYSGQRSILHVDKSGGIDLIIRPEILKRLSPLKDKISLLELWIAEYPQHIKIEVAGQLVKDLERYKTAHYSGNESGTTSQSIEDAVPSVKKLDVQAKKYFQDFTEASLKNSFTMVEKVVVSLFERISEELDKNGFTADLDIWYGFSNILYQSIIFLEHRMNATVKNFDDVFYLFNGNSVHESKLQNDYFNFVRGNLRTCKVTTERMDIAGGRSDVFFEFADFFIVAEIKRETGKLGMDGYGRKYIGQTMAYQGTSAKLGFLFVLDLNGNDGGVGALETNVKLKISESPEGIKSGVVILRMPGNRVTPSNIKQPKKIAAKKPAKEKVSTGKKKVTSGSVRGNKSPRK